MLQVEYTSIIVTGSGQHTCVLNLLRQVSTQSDSALNYLSSRGLASLANSLIMLRAELPRYTVIVLSVRLSVTSIFVAR